MKLTKLKLQQIIKEELRSLLSEQNPFKSGEFGQRQDLRGKLDKKNMAQVNKEADAKGLKGSRRSNFISGRLNQLGKAQERKPGVVPPPPGAKSSPPKAQTTRTVYKGTQGKAPAKAGTKQLPPVPPQKGAAIPQTMAGPLGKSKKGLDPKYIPGWDDGKSKYKPGPSLGKGTLRRGHSGKGVKHLQTLLHKAGFKGFTKEDGLFGPRTRKAVKKFQQMNGLKVDGIVGRNTAAEMQKATGGMTAPQAKQHISKKATIRKAAMQGDYDGDGVPDAMQAPKPGGFQGRGPGPWKNR